jgi:AraC-like DNA-binding protein
MSGVTVEVVASGPVSLEGLLSRWPVACNVDGEHAVTDAASPLSVSTLALVTSGPVWARLPGNLVERLDSGDLLICHDGEAVSISSTAPDHAPASWSAIDHSRPQAMIAVQLECIAQSLDNRLMPHPFVVRASQSPVVRALGAALIEAAQSGVAAPVCNAAATALYLQCLHAQLLSRPREIQLLSGLFDPEIGPVVAALIDSPARDWTVESLADVGGMSRSAFARKFRDLVGSAPIDFLVEVRMWQAARQLRQGSQDLKTIARQAGYQSPAAFSVAFKRWSGDTPSDYRRGT